MYDWILEADVYRLEKAIFESSKPEERESLQRLLASKRRALEAARLEAA